MALATIPAPTTAERIRSACLRAGAALLALDGADPENAAVHHLLADGSFAVTVPADGVAALTVAAAVGPRAAPKVYRDCWNSPTTPRCRCASRCAPWCGSAACCVRCRNRRFPRCST
ncbi:hypothetical protein [Mycolicibacterium insubricum]|uniref:hypothetical protein n=1 Tax=Mycolicibacterium insubricum TaxID=444597 RepID=UPI002AEA7029|nr:hypothetical protein [Mycolicibacterium insubricum]